MTRQIRFNGKKSYEDFKIRIISATVAEPKKREIKVTVPYRNGSIDLSDYDGNFYFDDTEVSYKMFVSDTDPVTLLRRIEKIKSWLCEAPQQNIYDNYSENYHFVGKCRTVETSLGEDDITANLEVTFDVAPYKVSDDFADTAWDTFSFDDDCLNQMPLSCIAHTDGYHSQPGVLYFCSYAKDDIVPSLRYHKNANDKDKRGLTMLDLNGHTLTENLYKETESTFRMQNFVVKPGTNVLALYGSGSLEIELVEEILC
jgi:hypothetical protein